jgi:hypothetical protein
VQHHIQLLSKMDGLRNIMLYLKKAFVALQMRDILGGPGNQVIERNHLMTVRKEPITEVRAEKARASGNKNSHDTQTFPSS